MIQVYILCSSELLGMSVKQCATRRCECYSATFIGVESPGRKC